MTRKGRLASLGFLPAFEHREVLAKFSLVFSASEALARVLVEFVLELGTELYHLVHGAVAGERSVFVTIDAVFFVLATVGVGSQDFRCERHPAALAEFHFHNNLLFCTYTNVVILKRPVKSRGTKEGQRLPRVLRTLAMTHKARATEPQFPINQIFLLF